MKKPAAAYLIILLILLAGCRSRPGEWQVPDQVQAPSPAPTQDPVATVAPSKDTPLSATEETPTQESTAIPSPTEELQDPAELLPFPSLFPGSWDDREIYVSGLVPSEVGILEELPGATIYHLLLDVTHPTVAEGSMEARYTNQEDEALSELFLHLFPETLGGDMNVANILVNGELAEYETSYGTLRVDLPQPLGPGEQVILFMDFVTTVPATVPGEESPNYRIFAYENGVLTLPHSYPMFAVYDDQGWHTDPSANHGDETFADSSFYLAQVSAPADQVLVASGVEVDREQAGDNQHVTFAGGPMRDFYFVSSDNYEVVQQQLGPILVNSYAPADKKQGAQMALDVAARSLESFAARFGPYPYSELDIVSTPTQALGVEYPGIFANAIRIYDLSDSSSSGVPNSVLLESTTAHETGHQWFYNLVGNDQLSEPWLDEALTQYVMWLYYVDSYGEQNAQGLLDSFEGRWARAEFADTPLGLPAGAYTGRDYGAIVYGRGPLFINDLAEIMGRETFDGFLRDYSEKYRWQIAYSQDFLDLAEQHCDCDLSGLFAENVFGN